MADKYIKWGLVFGIREICKLQWIKGFGGIWAGVI